ncbi:enhancer of polycomb-like protein [Tanacetum coccineum]
MQLYQELQINCLGLWKLDQIHAIGMIHQPKFNFVSDFSTIDQKANKYDDSHFLLEYEYRVDDLMNEQGGALANLVADDKCSMEVVAFARAKIEEFIECDLENKDEDWLEEYNKEGKILPTEKLDKKAGVITPLGAPIPVLLTFDVAVEALQPVSIQYGVFQSIYN